MKLVRATKDMRLGSDTVKKGCLGIVNGHAIFHAALVSYPPLSIGPVYEVRDIPVEGFDEADVPADDILAQKAADHLRWSMDPADPFTNELSAMLKEILRGKPRALEHLTERLAEMV